MLNLLKNNNNKLFHSSKIVRNNKTMSGGVLSEGANEFLDLVENYMSLPILIIMVLCTAHFIISQILDIGFSIACAFESEPDPEPDIGDSCQPLTSKIKGNIDIIYFFF